MRLRDWFTSDCEYGRKLLHAGLSGARVGGEEFLRGRRLNPLFAESSRSGLGFAAAGACIGALGGYLRNRQKSATSVLVFGMVGCAIGLGVGVASRHRGLGASVVSGALNGIAHVQDERWLEENPIDYA
jgi:hypothetical protein